eukprot:6489506-Amphidinium_carterae.1
MQSVLARGHPSGHLARLLCHLQAKLQSACHALRVGVMAIEQLGWLLYAKFAHYSFTITSIRIAKARLGGEGMRLESSYVLLQFSWLMATLFGPCLPILNALIALNASIYSILLFGCDSELLDLSAPNKHAASLPSFGLRTVALVTLAFHGTNLL